MSFGVPRSRKLGIPSSFEAAVIPSGQLLVQVAQRQVSTSSCSQRLQRQHHFMPHETRQGPVNRSGRDFDANRHGHLAVCGPCEDARGAAGIIVRRHKCALFMKIVSSCRVLSE